jgi:hypothetical protein
LKTSSKRSSKALILISLRPLDLTKKIAAVVPHKKSYNGNFGYKVAQNYNKNIALDITFSQKKMHDYICRGFSKATVVIVLFEFA